MNMSKLKFQICCRLKQARIEAGFATAKIFAETFNLKISTYALHEAGTRGMSLDVIELYASLLKININWLLTGVTMPDGIKVETKP